MREPGDKTNPADATSEEPPADPEAWFGELARALGWNPLVGADLSPVLRSYARTADSWATANRIALGAALAVAECQFRVLRQVLEDGAAANASLLRSAATPSDALPDQVWRAVRGFERLLENLQDLTGTVARSQAEIADAMSARMAEMAEEVEGYVLRLKQ
jgi:phasin family protein